MYIQADTTLEITNTPRRKPPTEASENGESTTSGITPYVPILIH